MYVAGIHRPPNNPLADFIPVITNTLEYTNNFCTVFAGDFNIYVLGNSIAMRKDVDTFHQHGLKTK